MKDTKIISAFPGCGKTYFFNNEKELTVLDSDSSKFDKSDFPTNYIKHIKENIGKVDVIMVSSHEEVRKALNAEGIYFFTVIPDGGDDTKEDFINRYKQRGSPQEFIDLIDKNFKNWIHNIVVSTIDPYVQLLGPKEYIDKTLVSNLKKI